MALYGTNLGEPKWAANSFSSLNYVNLYFQKFNFETEIGSNLDKQSAFYIRQVKRDG